ncbi:MAG: DsbA family protein [Rhodobacteraceae bacterium]|nr:DsbA family protein [Paracoccaceae bacterium]
MNRRDFNTRVAATIAAAAGLPAGATWAQDATDGAPEILEMSLGNPDAPVTVIEYASFTCPHCKRFHESTFKELKENYIDTGRIHFIYREVYFDRFGLWAGMVARCGGEERYFGITDLIYEQQSEWTAGDDPAMVADNLRRIGRTAGLTDDEVNACLQDGDKAQALVALYQENAVADDVSGTPTFIINGDSYSNMSYADFSRILDEKLSG